MTEYPLECYIKFIKIPYYGIAGMSKMNREMNRDT